MSKKINWQKLHKRAYYTTAELASTLGRSRSTIKYWSHNGLSPINRENFAWFFYGRDVIQYIKRKNKKFKVPTKPGEVYCFHCRKSRKVKLETLIIVKTGKKIGKSQVDQLDIQGNCVVCGYRCSQFSSPNCIGLFLKYNPEYSGDVPVSSNNQRKH